MEREGELKLLEHCLNPDFILLDEPFAGIDPIAIEDIQHIIKTLKIMG